MAEHVAVTEARRRGVAPGVQGRLEAFVAEVARPLGRAERRRNAALYVRGMLEAGARKSLEPVVQRLGGSPGAYQSLQQFVADSPWDPAALVRRVAERVAPALGVTAWVIDDTGFPKQGHRSPGVARQYSGTLGKVANCQIGVSLHAVGRRGTLPLGWALYLPQAWCDDSERRRRAKIPAGVAFLTKPELAAGLMEQAAAWDVPRAPVLADQAYGDNAALRTRLDEAGLEYVLAVGPETGVFGPQTTFAVPERRPGTGRPPSVARPDRPPQSVASLAAGLGPDAFREVAVRPGPGGRALGGRFATVRVRASHPVLRDRLAPREEWLIVEWPEGAAAPSGYWLANLAADTRPERLARLARLRWTIELDYKQLKGELGLDHYEGRSYLGWHHHAALVTAAHAFLTEERLDPKAPRPA
jgi:SRSO17 transposase